MVSGSSPRSWELTSEPRATRGDFRRPAGTVPSSASAIQARSCDERELRLWRFLAFEVFALAKHRLVQLRADCFRHFEQLVISIDLDGLAGGIDSHMAMAAAGHVLFQFGAEGGRRFCVEEIG